MEVRFKRVKNTFHQPKKEKRNRTINSINSTSPINATLKYIQKLNYSTPKKNQIITRNKSNSELSSSEINTVNNIDTVYQDNLDENENVDHKFFLNSMLKEEESPVKYESLRDAFKMR